MPLLKKRGLWMGRDDINETNFRGKKGEIRVREDNGGGFLGILASPS